MTDFKEMTFEDFKIDWLKDITEGNPNTIQLGNRFSQKLVMQWLDISDDTDDIDAV